MMDSSGNTTLHKAVLSQHLDVAKLLVKEDPEFEFLPNHVQETPLYLADESVFHDALIIILKYFKKLTYIVGPSNRTPLHVEVIQKHKGLEDVVSDMLGWKISLVYLLAGSENDWTIAIDISSIEGDCDSLVDEPDSHGNTPLHLLAASGNHVPELINHSREKKMSFNKQNQTPLDIALSCKETTNKEKLREDLFSIGRLGK
ncbi:ankyrin repeat-containing protein NPR4-like [Capsicum annuum]